MAGKLISSSMSLLGGNDFLRDRLADRTVSVIVADNVAEYVRMQSAKGREYQIGAWPCLAPPWDHAFIEYPNATGRQRRGVYMLSFDLTIATPGELAQLNGMVGAAIANAEEQCPGETVRWALIMILFVDDKMKVFGPAGCVIWILDPHGKELGNRWFLASDRETWPMAEDDQAMWMHSAMIPALQTIAFTHCKNAVVERQGRSEKLTRAYRRRHGQEPLRWQTVRLELPRRPGESVPANGAGAGISPSQHIVVGHFSHYGNCCPSAHPPRGKLFGRLEGVYWMPQHSRGDPTREVRSDRIVTVGAVDD